MLDIFQLYFLLCALLEIMANKKRKINPRSLENLKLGAKARTQGKVRFNCTLLPETVEWLQACGNASNTIDELVKAARAGNVRFISDNTHSMI
jgi:hypothetical protein